MNKNIMIIIYICLTLVAIGCSSLFFYSWNSGTSIKNQLQGNLLKSFNIDVCEINKHKIYVTGWSYIPNQDHSVTKIYAEMQNGRLIPISSNFVIRQDVSKIFSEGKLYKNSGFQAAKRFIHQENLTRKIFIVTQNENNQSYVAQFICK
ncbi:hypothetical protein [Commensalibacter nepenthis]|uniref:Lipoprotein n=1 Tax=Commensalibacter nepenthis TaxID=3043872 RepID=A0ABT6Q9D7_9PROT|nr:hypothetical protein [Commensalibacter sp. TBRC 10068]MDI2113522.1 hypothetical protein [Commensalibacter sp. TBRC 10068]